MEFFFFFFKNLTSNMCGSSSYAVSTKCIGKGRIEADKVKRNVLETLLLLSTGIPPHVHRYLHMT
jgi:hypothetical protein